MDVIRILSDVGVQNSEELILSHIKHNIVPISNNSEIYNFRIIGTFQIVESEINPTELILNDTTFSDIKPFPFMLKESYNLASIDYQFNITKHNSGTLAPQLLKFQTYLICGSKDISFAEYLQYRNEFTYIYNLGFPLSSEIIDRSLVNQERIYNLLENFDDSENNYKDYNYYIDKIKRVDQNGLDVFISENQKSGSELLYQSMIMINILKNGGDAIIKVNGNTTIRFMAGLTWSRSSQLKLSSWGGIKNYAISSLASRQQRH